MDEAARLIADYLTLARKAEAPHRVGCALRAQGQIFAAQGLRIEAAAVFDESIMTLDELGSHLELGRAFYQRGLMRQTGGETVAARDDLQRASALFDEAGAQRDREGVAELLR
jgi:hypothetical protein